MLRIIIADDEVGIIDLCKILIEYPDACVIGEAHNGVELFDKIGQLHPDAVITDICMPGMTGLELIEKAKQVYPDVSFIVMSGYTEFEYAQTSLRFGVWDYLLKPLKKTEINHTLEKLHKHLLAHRKQQADHAAVSGDLQESLSILRERYVREIWKTGTIVPVPVVGTDQVLDFTETQVQCILFCADSSFSINAEEIASLTKHDGTFDAIRDMARNGSGQSCLCFDWPYVACLLVYCEQTAQVQSEKLLRQIGEELRMSNSVNSFIRLMGAASMTLKGGSDGVAEAFGQARTALKWRLEKEWSGVIRYNAETAQMLQRRLPLVQPMQAHALHKAVETLDAEGASKTILTIWKDAESKPEIPGTRYHLLEEMLQHLDAAFRRLPDTDAAAALEHKDVHEILCGRYLPSECANRLTEDVVRRINQYQEHIQRRENHVIVQAKQYVAQHYTENISLNEVAKCVCLSAAYFSTLFKMETGSGFVEYLQHIRIKKAQELLKNTKMRIGDIAQAVGYHDMKFFNKVFQKETSVTPSEYRKFYS